MFYDYTVKDIDGNDLSMEEFKGKIVLIVNTASKCGFTKQYKGLEDLYQKYKDEGFVILGFPCNQFGGQEPGTNEEIKNFCDLTFSVSFPMMSKIDVNGKNEDPLYTFLKSEQGGIAGDRIKWNFTKFLIDREGNVVDRFASATTPEDIEEDIKKYL
ncbi:glutathione peroxidase [Peptoniphilus sp. MSJ-1]|uniref:Glutathione peroxidase n=1 Tax=Peptoniphilus ovalis TaxID=2841503 RepID=A0ABS6FI41_9FIRM|nr:glutathione peroxidase [Peptoniphilus ovalis]MBU5669845.1 glutathione peroxidase [Peptoniphilus ovalis]